MESLKRMETLEEMRKYIERKFSSEFFDAKATTQDAFGEQVRWDIVWTPKVQQFETCTGTIWAAPNYYTSAVPFSL